MLLLHVYEGVIHDEECYIEHNITTTKNNLSNIIILDYQIISEYDTDDENKILDTKKQTVSYEFVKDNEEKYYLNNVMVN